MTPHAISSSPGRAPAASPAASPAAGLGDWGPPEAAVWLDFLRDRYRLGAARLAVFGDLPGLSVIRPGAAWGLDPGAVPVSAAAGRALVVPGRGLLHEPAATRLNGLDIHAAMLTGGTTAEPATTTLPDGRPGTAWHLRFPQGGAPAAAEVAPGVLADINPNPQFALWDNGLPDGFVGINLDAANTVTEVPGGVRIRTDAQGTFAGLTSLFLIEPGTAYRVECEITALSAQLRIDLTDASNPNVFSAPGVFSFVMTGAGTARRLRVARHTPGLDCTIARLEVHPLRTGPHTFQVWLRTPGPAPAHVGLATFATPVPATAGAQWTRVTATADAAGLPAGLARLGDAASEVLAVWPDVQEGDPASPILAPGATATRAAASISIAGLDAIDGISAGHVFTATFEDGSTAPLAASGGTLTLPAAALAYRSITG